VLRSSYIPAQVSQHCISSLCLLSGRPCLYPPHSWRRFCGHQLKVAREKDGAPLVKMRQLVAQHFRSKWRGDCGAPGPVSVNSYKFLRNYGNRSGREWTANTADLGQTLSTRQQRTASHSLLTALRDALNYVVTPNRNFSELIISRQVLLRVQLYCDA
jgi:hypothetical protein